MLIFSVISASGLFHSCTGNEEAVSATWKEYPPLPPPQNVTVQSGLASPFAGTSNGAVIVAGGCNFPDQPLTEGGAKRFHNDIFILTEKDGMPEWLTGFSLEKPVAYGASVSTGTGVLCIGGSGNEGLFRDVFQLTWNDKKQEVEIQAYPPLPFPMTNMGTALVENVVYVAGGLTGDGASNKFLKLDLSKQKSPEFGWEILSDFPGEGRQLPVMVAQDTPGGSLLFLFSGLATAGTSGLPVIHTDGLKYDLKRQAWQTLPDVRTEPGGKTHLLYAGAGVKSGKNKIICMGGANYDILFDALKRERDAQAARQAGDLDTYRNYLEWKQYYLTRSVEWYQLNSDILIFNTLTESWKEIGKLSFPAFVCAAVVEWKNGWLLINGEIKPGIRTPKVYYGELTESK